VEIHWRNLEEIDERQREAVEGRLRALADGHTDLIDVRIAARSTGHHRHGDREVRIACQARGSEIVAARVRPDAGAALDEVVDAFEREVQRLRDRRRDHRQHERLAGPPFLGIVDRVLRDEGYGFILTDGGEQVYFHRNAVKNGLSFESLDEGDRVALNIEQGNQGLQATVVCAAPPDAPVP
jgi:cold shock CspA family protein/ribosome-associated translation inhibitor RaiA